MSSTPISGASSSGATIKRHIRPLTGLRFVAAIHVVFYHSAGILRNGWPTVPEWLLDLMHIGYSGVNLFFVLSGFILAYTYATPDGALRTSLRRFWWARFARIYPLYVFSLILVAPLVVHHFLSTNPWRLGFLKIAVSGGAAATLSQAWIPHVRAIWNPPAWSLSAEAYFYLAFPLLLPIVWKASKSRVVSIGLACWAFSIVPWVLSTWLVPHESGGMATEAISNHPVTVFLRSSPMFRVHEFVLGICLARIVLDPHEIERIRRSPILRWGGLAIGVSSVAVVSVSGNVPRMLVHGGVFDALYVLVIAYLVHGDGLLCRFLGSRPLVRLGEASYGIYILHIPILSLMLQVVDSGHEAEPGLVFLAAYLAIVILGSLVAFRSVEEPARRLINARSSRR